MPEPFVIVEDPPFSGMARLDIGMQRCDALIIDGVERSDVIFAHSLVDIEWPEDVDDQPPPSELGIHLVQYQLWFVTNDPHLFSYLHDRGATSFDVRLVSDLAYEEDDLGLSVRFKAPAPAPSPFEATAELSPRPPVEPRIVHDIFRAVPRGAQWFHVEHDIRSGPLTNWTIEPQEGSQLDVLLCKSPRTFAETPTDVSLSFEEPNDAFFSVTLPETEVGRIGDAACT